MQNIAGIPQFLHIDDFEKHFRRAEYTTDCIPIERASYYTNTTTTLDIYDEHFPLPPSLPHRECDS